MKSTLTTLQYFIDIVVFLLVLLFVIHLYGDAILTVGVAIGVPVMFAIVFWKIANKIKDLQ